MIPLSYLLKKKGNNADKTVISTNEVRRNLDCKEISRFARNPPPIWQARLPAQARLSAQTRGLKGYGPQGYPQPVTRGPKGYAQNGYDKLRVADNFPPNYLAVTKKS